jgi:predicted transcriptional regulator
LRRVRKQAGLTQSGLGKNIHLRQATVSRLEAGELAIQLHRQWLHSILNWSFVREAKPAACAARKTRIQNHGAVRLDSGFAR